MGAFKTKFFIHNIDSGSYFETLLLWAAVSILVIRFYLFITGYPQLGVRGFHFAHILWGGFLMLTAIVILLAFFGGNAKRLAAVIGGIGFGAFIDELGKFITRDNNYFFQPTIAIIYVIFVIIFLIFRYIQRKQKYSQGEYLANAFDLVRSAVLNQVSLVGRERAENILDKCDQSNAAVGHLRKILEVADLAGQDKTSRIHKMAFWVRSFYRKLSGHRWFSRIVMLFFAVYAFLTVFHSSGILRTYIATNELNLSYMRAGQFVSSIAAAVVAIAGMVRVVRSRLDGYRLFRDSVLISIFLTQFFDFYKNQLGALVALVANLLVFLALEYMILQEEPRKETTGN